MFSEFVGLKIKPCLSSFFGGNDGSSASISISASCAIRRVMIGRVGTINIKLKVNPMIDQSIQ
jgi:hypothetical protein